VKFAIYLYSSVYLFLVARTVLKFDNEPLLIFFKMCKNLTVTFIIINEYLFMYPMYMSR
jgi:hypothetical protein